MPERLEQRDADEDAGEKAEHRPDLAPRSRATQTTMMSAKSGLAPRMRMLGATDVCSSRAAKSSAPRRASSPAEGSDQVAGSFRAARSIIAAPP